VFNELTKLTYLIVTLLAVNADVLFTFFVVLLSLDVPWWLSNEREVLFACRL